MIVTDVLLYKGDCLEEMKKIPDGSVDLVLADPPYGTTACKWDTVIPFEPMWAQLKRVAKKNAAIVLFSSQPFTTELIMSNKDNYRYSWYWRKERGTNISSAKYQPMRIIEDVVVFGLTSIKYKPLMVEVKPYRHVLPLPKKNHTQQMDSKSVDDDGNRIYKEYNKAYPTNVLEFGRDNMSKGKSYHPTQKPVALLEYLIRTYTQPGETVLDFTMGSGSTGVACVNTGRDFIGIELDEGYYNIAEKRIEDARTTPLERIVRN